MSDWQPIETAPKDGTLVWAYASRFDDANGRQGMASFLRTSQGFGVWHWRHGRNYGGSNPTHWMPLPEPPETSVS
jgi:hypothetical protein